jgi:hypothetical protein
MEQELRDLKAIRAMEDEPGDVHGSTTLLDPSEREAPTTNDDVVSEAYNTSMSSRRSFDHHSEHDLYVHRLGVNTIFINVLPSQSPAKHRNRSLLVFIRPIIAFSWQFIVLVMLMVFIIRTESTAYPILPSHLATLFVQYPQGTAIATTLVGSLLSLISTKCVSCFQFQVLDC